MAQSKTLELSIRIAGKVDKSLLAAISSAQGSVSGLSTTLSRVGTMGLAAMGTLAAGTAAAIVKCTDEAKRFEAQMGDVVKYVDGLADANGKISDTVWASSEGGNGNTYAENYGVMKDAILDLSTQIPYTAEDLTRLAAAAGQSGKSMDEITGGFLKDSAMWGKAMDISADQAGDWAAKWEAAFNMDHREIMVLADQINYLGANSATTAAEIAAAVNAAASMGQIGGIDVATTAALADAMLATGVASDRVGTSIKRMITNFSLGENATKKQAEMWNELGFSARGVARSMQADSVGTLRSIFNAIHSLPKDRQIAALSTLFGQWAVEGGAKIVNNLDAYEKALDMVSDPARYTGSMEREFVIKSSTAESIDLMTGNAFKALKIEVGDAFLPVKKELGLMLLSAINSARDYMPQISQIAGNMAAALSRGVERAGELIKWARPSIERALDYVANNGPQVVSVLKGMGAAFLAMKFAPGIEALLLGRIGPVGGRSGGLMGLLSGLVGIGGKAADMLLYLPAAMGQFAAVFRQCAALFGIVPTLLNLAGLGRANAYFNGLIAAFARLRATLIGGWFTNAVGTVGQILSGILQTTGLTDLVNSAASFVRNFAGLLVGRASGIIAAVLSSAPIQFISGFLGKIPAMAGVLLGPVKEFAIAGAGLLSSVWGPFVSGFGSLLAGAAPVILAVSGVIAVMSILGDHLEGIRGIVGGVFGDTGLAVFDSFIGALGRAGIFISGLFANGGVAAALAPVRQAILAAFGPEACAAFSGLIQILQSVMSVIGQIVGFATGTVKPIIQDIFGFIAQIVVPSILRAFTAAAPAISGIISGLGSAVVSCMQMIGSAIQAALPVIGGVISVVLNIANAVVPALLAGYETFSSGLAAIASAIQAVFQGINDFVSGTFTMNWTRAWQGIRDIFGGIFRGLGALIKTPLNAVISAINKIHVTAPNWPVLGDLAGKEFGFNIPMLAKGGFTNGPSIAGEAGTEAVISFQRSVRRENIDTWIRAGRMLEVNGGPVAVSNIRHDTGAGLALPMLAGGGFTNGVSIAGEAGTEAVISFQRSVRRENIDTWIQAGRILGVDGKQAGAAVSNVRYYAGGGFTSENGAVALAAVRSYEGGFTGLAEIPGLNRQPTELRTLELPDRGGTDRPDRGGGPVSITYAPTIIIQGSAEREVIDAALRDDKARFDAWYEEKKRSERRVRF